MGRSRKILVNNYEEKAFQLLREALREHNARLWGKVRIADAIDIKNSGLTKDEYSYALKAHFDFVVEPEGEPVSFAVEFDEEHHATDPKAQKNDRLKNTICEKLGMPLLRVGASELQRAGKFSVLGWLAELWFLYNSFLDAQENGLVPFDEPFDYQSIFTMTSADGKVEYFPFDPFRNYRELLSKLVRSKEALSWSTLAVETTGGYVKATTCIFLNNGHTILGKAKCRSCMFPPLMSSELAEELSTKNTFHNYWKYRQGVYTPLGHRDADKLLIRFEQNNKPLTSFHMGPAF